MNTFRHKLLFLLFLLSLPALACGMETEPSRSRTDSQVKYTDTQPTPEASTVVKMVVVASQLNIRAEPSEKATADPLGLEQGQKVNVYLDCTGGHMDEWLAIDRDCTRWVKASWLEAE